MLRFLVYLLIGDGTVGSRPIGTDGYKRREQRALYGSKEFLESVQCLLLTHNIACSITENKTRKGTFYLQIRRNKVIQIAGKEKFITENYNDLVWCVEVPNHTLIAEREGKPFICGNSCINGKAEEPVENNFEYHLYKILDLMLKQSKNKNIKVTIPNSKFYSCENYGHRIYMSHGDTIRGGGNTAIERRAKEMLLNVPQGYSLYLMGHRHSLARLPITDNSEVLLNGCWVDKDDYAWKLYGVCTRPAQWLFASSKTRAISSLCVAVDFRKEK